MPDYEPTPREALAPLNLTAQDDAPAYVVIDGLPVPVTLLYQAGAGA